MAGNPARLENSEDRKESEIRSNVPLLVRYFSMYMMTESKKLMNTMLDYSKAANYPLLPLHGEKDNLIDKKECDLLYDTWKSQNKQYTIIAGGSQGKSTVI